MKAPEKIYLCPSELAGIDYDEEWYDSPFGDSIEYTRTDAFIEKVEEYIYKQLNEGRIECGDIEKFIEDFRKYMEGE